jgi:hypothetical protein
MASFGKLGIAVYASAFMFIVPIHVCQVARELLPLCWTKGWGMRVSQQK